MKAIDGATYRDGFKIVGSERIEALGARSFPSSNGYTSYTTTAWADETFSCTCSGWCILKKNKRTGLYKPRSCWHVKEIALPGGFVNMVEAEEKGLRRINLNA